MKVSCAALRIWVGLYVGILWVGHPACCLPCLPCCPPCSLPRSLKSLRLLSQLTADEDEDEDKTPKTKKVTETITEWKALNDNQVGGV